MSETVKFEYWTKEGQFFTTEYLDIPWKDLHREDGPAYSGYYQNDILHYEKYYINGLNHRDNGPGILQWYPNKIIMREIYKNNGKFHNTEKAAIISYTDDGKIFSEIYCILGEEFTKEKWEKVK